MVGLIEIFMFCENNQRECISGQMVGNTQVTGWTIICTERVCIHGKMEDAMMEII